MIPLDSANQPIEVKIMIPTNTSCQKSEHPIEFAGIVIFFIPRQTTTQQPKSLKATYNLQSSHLVSIDIDQTKPNPSQLLAPRCYQSLFYDKQLVLPPLEAALPPVAWRLLLDWRSSEGIITRISWSIMKTRETWGRWIRMMKMLGRWVMFDGGLWLSIVCNLSWSGAFLDRCRVAFSVFTSCKLLALT